MEKWKQTFVYPLILSWMIIFVHDSIPHNHHRLHASSAETEETASVHSHAQCNSCHIHNTEESETCQFLVDVPAHSFTDFTFINEDVHLFIPELLQTTHSFTENTLNITALHLSQNHLRAPPLLFI